MHIAIIGGGLTGLTAGHELLKRGHTITIFEKSSAVGGLAGGFTKKTWKWSLEQFYHHYFTNDKELIDLSNELGIASSLLTLKPITSTLIQPGKAYQLDSPLSLLRFPLLSPLDKIRTAGVLGFCKINPFWKPLESRTTESFFKTIGGKNAWDLLWKPLMEGKFGSYTPKIAASWLWARFHKRTMKLGYFKGGFRTFVQALERAITKKHGEVLTDVQVDSIQKTGSGFTVAYKEGKKPFLQKKHVDRILLTTPSPIASKLMKFPESFVQQLQSIPHLYAQVLILETNEPILPSTYWLNINDRSFPFLAVVAHTNMVSSSFYGGKHITYVGNYLPEGHPFLSASKEALYEMFFPYLKKINPHIKKQRNMNTITLFTAAHAQPVHTINYSKKAPPMKTPIPGVFLANLDSIYPWDRGTNYAVSFGQRAAEMIHASR